MDKNTITGLVLIAILLVGFSFLSRPSKEQLAAQQRYYDSIAQVQQREADEIRPPLVATVSSARLFCIVTCESVP